MFIFSSQFTGQWFTYSTRYVIIDKQNDGHQFQPNGRDRHIHFNKNFK